MKIQYASFLIPLHADSQEQEAMNRFIRGHRVIQSRKELAAVDGSPHWAILVEYLDSGSAEKTAADAPKNKVDYKEILSALDFSIYFLYGALGRQPQARGRLPPPSYAIFWA